MINKIDTLIPVVVFLSAWVCGPLIIFLTSLISIAAYAACDVVSGAGETTDVSLGINESVQITRAADFVLVAEGGSGALKGQSDCCLFRNSGDNYKMKLTADARDYTLPVSPI